MVLGDPFWNRPWQFQQFPQKRFLKFSRASGIGTVGLYSPASFFTKKPPSRQRLWSPGVKGPARRQHQKRFSDLQRFKGSREEVAAEERHTDDTGVSGKCWNSIPKIDRAYLSRDVFNLGIKHGQELRLWKSLNCCRVEETMWRVGEICEREHAYMTLLPVSECPQHIHIIFPNAKSS